MNVKHGKSTEISAQLSTQVATTFAQWIGGYTVIGNQKTVQSKLEYQAWVSKGKPEGERPHVDTKVAYLTKTLDFLKAIPSQIRRNAGAKWLESVNAAKAGLRKHPRVKPKNKKRNCYVTNELFDIQALDSERCLIQIKRNDTKQTSGEYLCGIVMPFAKEDAGKSFYLSRKGSRFWISMSYDLNVEAKTEKEIKIGLKNLSDKQLNDAVVGYDLGVNRQVTGSDQQIYHIDEAAQEKVKVIRGPQS